MFTIGWGFYSIIRRIAVDFVNKNEEEGIENNRAGFRSDVFTIHSNVSDDEKFTHEIIKPKLIQKGFTVLTFEDLSYGRNVVASISEAIQSSTKTVLILSPNAVKSRWCSLELILALEKSRRLNKSSVVVLIKDELEDYKESDGVVFGKCDKIHFEPILNFLGKDVPIVEFNSDKDCTRLAKEIRDYRKIADVLPAGNIAHAQVWSHYTGLLQYLLPEIKRLIQATEWFNKNEERFPLKLFELVPESCKCQYVVKDEDGRIKNIGKLPELVYFRAGNKRKASMNVYSVTDKNGEIYYCVAEYPPVIAGIRQMVDAKETRLAEGERRVQIERFYYTMSYLLSHPLIEDCQNMATIVYFNDEKPGFCLADEMIRAIKASLPTVTPANAIKRKEEEISKKITEDQQMQNVAFIMCCDEESKSSQCAEDICKHLDSLKLSNTYCTPGNALLSDIERHLRKYRWVVLILTKDSLKYSAFTFQMLAILYELVDEGCIRIVPVLVDIHDVETIPEILRMVIYASVDEKKTYLNQLACILQGKQIPIEVETLVPAGNVAYGLAWTYVLNYLQYMLIDPDPSKKESCGLLNAIHKMLAGKDVSCPLKVFIIVPYSCNCYGTLTDADSRIRYYKSEDVRYINLAGTTNRTYTVSMYTFTHSGTEYFFIGQYAAPVQCLNDMNRLRIAGLHQQAMEEQAKVFCHTVTEIMRQSAEAAPFVDRVEIVFYDDKDPTTSLLDEMQKRLNS